MWPTAVAHLFDEKRIGGELEAAAAMRLHAKQRSRLTDLSLPSAPVDLDLDTATRDFIGRCGYSDRGGAAAQNAAGFLDQLIQVTRVTR
jgi:hypothetical protein